MNAAAEVLRLRHWPPRGVYTRWRPRKRFAPASYVYHQHLKRKLSALRSAVCSKLDICASIFLLFSTNFLSPFRHLNPSEPASSKTGFGAVVQGMATPVRCRLRASLRVRILTPGHQKGGRVARYFLRSLALNSVAKTALLVSS